MRFHPFALHDTMTCFKTDLTMSTDFHFPLDKSPCSRESVIDNISPTRLFMDHTRPEQRQMILNSLNDLMWQLISDDYLHLIDHFLNHIGKSRDCTYVPVHPPASHLMHQLDKSIVPNGTKADDEYVGSLP